MIASLLLQLHEYALLNGSFSDDVGLFTGKSAVALLNYEWSAPYNAPYYSDTVGYSFLEEIIAGSNQKTSLSYGDGLMGFGSLVDYLRTQNQIDATSQEVLEEYEPICFALLPTVKELGLLRGISGFGLYLLNRFEGQYDHPVFEQYIFYCLSTIGNLVKSSILDNSLWTGWSGILFFLKNLSVKTIRYQDFTKSIINAISQKVTISLNVNEFKWANFHAFFAISKLIHSREYTKNLQNHLAAVPNQISNLPICDGAFIALLIHLMSQDRLSMIELNIQKENVINAVKNSIEHLGLGVVFPFNPTTNMVQVGLQGGVSGTLLPLLSIEKNRFDWLQLIGIDV